MVQHTEVVEEALMGLYARILRCPLGENPEECPMYEVRKWPIEERLEWLHSQTSDEIVELFQHHSKCLQSKLSLPAPPSLQPFPDLN